MEFPNCPYDEQRLRIGLAWPDEECIDAWVCPECDRIWLQTDEVEKGTELHAVGYFK